ncbi:hypothetical protein GGS23DRAFT_582544 [Durotheca rogersii]|uniref:uncharacterized protein n=1 Tax=Durotheca rogersii TaxID=419775 RepID=UPI002220C8B3|nr:uncharacterized protein GGS23DRAFT_582544 [Durotheca rogersii]KAI5860095.1 hypothetical protein GGS23DRAFT_582544 [Durotheca rogersii]
MTASAGKRRFVPGSSPGADDATGADAVVVAADGARKRRNRHANVYDAVAGRVTSSYGLDDGSEPEVLAAEAAYRRRRYRPAQQQYQHRNPTLAPEEVLFRRAAAPVRYAEKDIYRAHEALGPALPDSDMLKAIHSYASHFYAARSAGSTVRGVHIDECSMDETALLAFGVLLEEAGREVLGSKGDLVFTEGVSNGPRPRR